MIRRLKWSLDLDDKTIVDKINALIKSNNIHEEQIEKLQSIVCKNVQTDAESRLENVQDGFGEKQPVRFTPEMMSEILQKMKIPVVTDESAQNLLSENIELKAENLRLVQDLNRVCDQKFEELDVSVRQCNKDLFAENQKLKSALDWCIKKFKSLEQVLDEKASARDMDDPDLYAWAVQIKPIWLELKEITGIDYIKGGDNE